MRKTPRLTPNEKQRQKLRDMKGGNKSVTDDKMDTTREEAMVDWNEKLYAWVSIGQGNSLKADH